MTTFKTLSLTLIASLVCVSCGSKSDGGSDVARSTSHDVENSANIRYYELDSIATQYELIAKLNADAEVVLKNYQTEEAKKRAELQSMAQKIEEKARSGGYLTQQSYEADMADFQRKQQQAENYLATLQSKAMEQGAMQQQALLDSITSFLKDYNATNKFDAILVLPVGSICLPELNITKEIVDGLNARYKKSNPEPEQK